MSKQKTQRLKRRIESINPKFSECSFYILNGFISKLDSLSFWRLILWGMHEDNYFVLLYLNQQLNCLSLLVFSAHAYSTKGSHLYKHRGLNVCRGFLMIWRERKYFLDIQGLQIKSNENYNENYRNSIGNYNYERKETKAIIE